MSENNVQKRSFSYLLKNVIGPAFLMVSTTVGAGSIVSAATSGASFGYQMLWWILVIVIFNALYIVTAYKYTLTTGEDMLTAIRHHYGKPLAIISSILMIFGYVTFSISNFTAIGMAINILIPIIPRKVASVCCFAVAMGLTWFAKNYYGKISKVATYLVLLVTCLFVITVALLGGPDWSEAAAGFIPSLKANAAGVAPVALMMAMFGTSTRATAPIFTSWQIKSSALTKDDLKNGTIAWDLIARNIGLFLMCALIICCGAIVLKPAGLSISNGADLVAIFEPVLGTLGARYIFGIGFFGCTIMPFLMAPRMAATILATGLGKESDMDKPFSKIFVTAVMAFAAIFGLINNAPPAQLMVLSQLGSAVCNPVVCVLVIMLVNRKELGEHKAKPVYTIALVAAYLLIMYATVRTVASFF